jgi:carbamoyl-phosphate synthase large subunit
MREQVQKLAFELQVRGLMNVQFAVKNNEVYLIEVNPRAARTVRSSPKPPAYRWRKWRRA